jgi:hypothetical protein
MEAEARGYRRFLAGGPNNPLHILKGANLFWLFTVRLAVRLGAGFAVRVC